MAKYSAVEESDFCSSQITNLFLSAAAGGLLGAATALLCTPTTGQKLRRQLADTFDDLSDKGQDVVHDFTAKGKNAVDCASDCLQGLKCVTSYFTGKNSKSLPANTNMLIGAVGGGILGAAAILLLATKDKEDCCGITQKIKQAGESAKKKFKPLDWIETAKDLIQAFQDKAGDVVEEVEEKGEQGKQYLSNIVDWASLGLRVWQNTKSRR